MLTNLLQLFSCSLLSYTCSCNLMRFIHPSQLIFTSNLNHMGRENIHICIVVETKVKILPNSHEMVHSHKLYIWFIFLRLHLTILIMKNWARWQSLSCLRKYFFFFINIFVVQVFSNLLFN